MKYNEMIAFVESASGHLGVDKDDVFEIITNPEYSSSLNYTIVTDAVNIWSDALKFARNVNV